ncbi:MAG: hypothetical protein OEL76_13500 [Siculibacillus sp.]|nr:hypothetical protein [Siculibacillus sp.]
MTGNSVTPSTTDVAATEHENELSEAELASVAGGATVPVKKKPQPGSGSGSETHDSSLKNQSTKLR